MENSRTVMKSDDSSTRLGVERALTQVPCRGKIPVNTFPSFGNGVIGRDNVSKSPDREEPVRLRRYTVGFRSRVEIEIAAETVKYSARNPT